MKLAVIGLLAVVVLGGGAAGAYFYLSQPAEASAGPADEAAKAEAAAKEKAAAEAAAKLTEFVPLDVIVLPILDETGVTQTVTLVVSIEVPDKLAADEAKRLSPKLKDAFIQDMYGTLSRKNAMKDGVIQTGMIKERLTKASVKILGEGHVNDVLLQLVQQRNM